MLHSLIAKAWDSHCSKHFAIINLFNPHSNPTLSSLYIVETKLHRLINMSPFTQQISGKVYSVSLSCSLNSAGACCCVLLRKVKMGLQGITLSYSIAAFCCCCPPALSHHDSLHLIHALLGTGLHSEIQTLHWLISSHLDPKFALCFLLCSYIFIVLLDLQTWGTV